MTARRVDADGYATGASERTGEMSEIRCIHCDCELTGKMDTFGDVGFEACQWCYLSHIEEYEAVRPTECIVCHKHSAYERTEAGYPGLFHCERCGAWWDVVDKLPWRIVLTPAAEPPPRERDGRVT